MRNITLIGLIHVAVALLFAGTYGPVAGLFYGTCTMLYFAFVLGLWKLTRAVGGVGDE